VLLEGRSPADASASIFQRGDALTAAGVDFDEFTDPALEIQALIWDHGSGTEHLVFPSGTRGIVATSADGAVIGALLVEERPRNQAVQITHLVVCPTWRRRGVATVMLGLVWVAFPWAVAAFGGCARAGARLFDRAGFTVFEEGSRIVIPHLSKPMANPSEHHPCWFLRVI
jgi:GNAT superfamily N-acetyltransferase